MRAVRDFYFFGIFVPPEKEIFIKTGFMQIDNIFRADFAPVLRFTK